MRKSKIVALAVLIGVLTIIGVAYAIDYTGGYFRATGSNPDNYSYTEMSLNKIHFTGSNDTIDMSTGYDQLVMGDDYDAIRMGAGDDQFHMASGSDLIGLGAGSDYIRLYGGLNGASTETIGFNDLNDVDPPTTYIKYTSSSDTIEIKSNSGDVIITLGQ